MITRLAQGLDSLMQKYTPDPYIIAVFLTFLVVLLAWVLTPSSIDTVILAWGDGFWSLISFTMQMVMILLGGYVVASSPLVRRGLLCICQKVPGPSSAVVIVTLLSSIASCLNWGFGLVVGAFLAVEMARAVPAANFRILVASAYSGFLLWHGGLSGSIPLVVNTRGSFSEEWIGGVIPIEQTLLSPLNLAALLGLLILLPVTNVLLAKITSGNSRTQLPLDSHAPEISEATAAQQLEISPWIPVSFVLLGLGYLGLVISRGRFSLDLNTMSFLFLFTGILLHWRTRSFLHSVNEAAKKVGPLLVQYPIYAGIMGIMTGSGLAAKISEFFVNTSNSTTFPLFTFYGAGLVNFFVPSGGGQWAVQAPVVIPAAQALGVDLSKVVMAVAWGDAWTNMAQPFWALPLLAIAGLGAKDILGFCTTILLISGVYLSVLFLIF